MHLSLPLAAALGDSPGFLESIQYQFVGLIVVFSALGAIWLLMEGMGVLFRALDRRQLRVEPAIVDDRQGPPVVSGVTPELIAVITAAAHDSMRAGEYVVAIVPEDHRPPLDANLAAWSSEGRRQIFASHKVR